MEKILGTVRDVTPEAPKVGLFKQLRAFITREAKEKTVYDLQIVFHRKAAGELVHGQLTVSCKQRQLDNRPINFAFVGVRTAPLMTPDVVYHIWTEAIEQGYVPHGIYSYKGMSTGA